MIFIVRIESPASVAGTPANCHRQRQSLVSELRARVSLSSTWTVVAIALQVALAVYPSISIANDIARIRTQLTSESTSWVGEKVSMSIDLMSSTLFAGTPRFDLPEVPGVIIMKVKGSPVLSSEEVDGESWSIQRHSFSIYAHRAGSYNIPSFPVRFSVAPAFGKPPELQRLNTESISFEAKLPPGAEGLSLLISTSELNVSELWNPSVPQDKKIELEVGDALTRKITLKANEVPGMALPQIVVPAIEGLSTYEQPSVIDDQENRGALTGIRTNSTTYVCQRPGSFALPELVIPWWDTDARQMQRIKLPAVILNVMQVSDSDTTFSSNQLAPNDKDVTGTTMSRVQLIGLLLVTLMCGLAWYYRNRIKNWIANEKAKRNQSEAAHFARFQLACRKNDPVAVYNALMKWIEIDSHRINVATIEEFLKDHNQPRLASEMIAVQRAAIDRSIVWSGQKLSLELAKARHRNRRLTGSAPKKELPSLNPN